jgi:sulfide:quinone oxidoreductase
MSQQQVLIAGGGIAGLEALIALRDLAGVRIASTLIAPEPEFTYKPFTVEEPFSSQPAERRALAPIAEEFGAEFVQQGLIAIDPTRKTISLTDGARDHRDPPLERRRGGTAPGLRRLARRQLAASAV